MGLWGRCIVLYRTVLYFTVLYCTELYSVWGRNLPRPGVAKPGVASLGDAQFNYSDINRFDVSVKIPCPAFATGGREVMTADTLIPRSAPRGPFWPRSPGSCTQLYPRTVHQSGSCTQLYPRNCPPVLPQDCLPASTPATIYRTPRLSHRVSFLGVTVSLLSQSHHPPPAGAVPGRPEPHRSSPLRAMSGLILTVLVSVTHLHLPIPQ